MKDAEQFLIVGPGVKFVKPDDLVVLHWRLGKGIQSETPKYYNLKKLMLDGLLLLIQWRW